MGCFNKGRSGAIIIGVLQLTIGVLVAAHFLLNHLEVIGFRPEIREALYNATKFGNDSNESNPFRNKSTVEPYVDDPDADSDDKLMGYILFGLLMLVTITSGILSLVIAFMEKNLQRMLQFAIWATSFSVGLYIGTFISNFILGYHWIDLLPLLIWGLVQIFFVISLKRLTNTSDFQRVPVPA